MESPLTAGDRNTLLSAARMTLQTVVKTGRLPELELRSPGVNQPAGAFVTLHALGQLRGSMGDPGGRLPLYRLVMDLTASAADDDRYRQIGPEELHQVRITIAVIRGLERLREPGQIVVGSTGLALKADPPLVLPPETLPEQGWSAEEALEALEGLRSRARLASGARALDLPVYCFTTDRFSEEDEAI